MSGRVKVRLSSGERVTLHPRAFVAAGGEGSVYARGDVAYKIYADPARAISAAKVAELRRIAHPGVVVPRALLLREHDRVPIGYAMRFLPGAWALAQLVPSAFWARHGLSAADARGIAVRLASAIAAVHAAGCAVGDLSATNVLVAPGSLEPFLVDTDSFQTPGFACTALTQEIADPLAPHGRCSAGSDWFSFAVLVFELLSGLHPYKGKHPTIKGMAARMRAGISALSPEVRAPAAWRGVSSIPREWLPWLRDVLESGHRGAPSFATASTKTTARATSAVGLEVVGMLPDGTPLRVAVDRAAGVVRLSARMAVSPAEIAVVPSAMVQVGGRVILHVDDRLVALDPVLVGSRVFVGMVTIATVMPLSTTLWPGIAISDVVGRVHGYLLDGARAARVVRLSQLDGKTIVHLAHERGAIEAVAREGASTRRLRLRVGPGQTVSEGDAGSPAA